MPAHERGILSRFRNWFLLQGIALSLLCSCDSGSSGADPLNFDEPPSTIGQRPSVPTPPLAAKRQSRKPQNSDFSGLSADISDGLLITGTVFRSDGTPAGGTTATLQVASDSAEPKHLTCSTTASADGTYRLLAAVGPDYLLRAYSDNESVSESLLETFYSNAHLPARWHVRQNLRLVPNAALSGVVLSDDGTSVGLAEIHIYTHSAETGGANFVKKIQCAADGRFTADSLSSGGAVLRVLSPNHVPLTYETQAPNDDLVLRLKREGASISGNVFLYGSGDAAPETTVTLTRLPSPQQRVFSNEITTTVSDSLGFFRFDRLPTGRYFLSAEKEQLRLLTGNRRGKIPVRLGDGESTTGIALHLYPGHRLTGIVLDAETSAPLADALVQVEADRVTTAGTDSTGRYSLSGLFAGHLRLAVGHDGYDTETIVLRVPKELHIEQEVRLGRAETLSTTVTLSGNVLNSEGNPVPGSTVRINNLTPLPVDPDGGFQVEASLRPNYGGIRLIANAPGHIGRPYPYDLGGVTTGIQLLLEPCRTLTGIVVDTGGDPVPLALVSLDFPHSMGHYYDYADLAGEFRLGQFPLSETSIGVTKDGFEYKALRVPAGGNMDIEVVLEPIDSQCYVAGRVTDRNGQPLIGARVSHDYDGVTVTSADGKFRLSGLRCQSAYTCKVSLPEYQTTSVQVQRSDSANAVIVLDDSMNSTTEPPSWDEESIYSHYGDGVIAGRVVRLPDKVGLSGRRVFLNYRSVISGTNGSFAFTGLVPGTYKLQFTQNEIHPKIVRLGEGESVELELYLGTGQLEAVIQRQGVTAFCPVTLTQRGGSTRVHLDPDEAGLIQASNLVPGTYEASITFWGVTTTDVLHIKPDEVTHHVFEIPDPIAHPEPNHSGN